jgi:hypothetical protein
MISHYFYDGQLRSYLLQFCNIFAGLKVATGKGICEDEQFITVPITMASRDRVVAAIAAGNTQNKPFSIPAMAATMTGIALAPGNRKGINVVDRRVFLPEGGVYPTDLKVSVRVMPIPYIMTCELSIYASNTMQLHQIIEQLLVLFDPTLQIQKNDSAFDWTKISVVELVGINNEENASPGGERRLITWSLNFDMPIWLSAPMDIKDELVRSIFIRMGNLEGFQVNEVDENGNLVPFAPGYEYGTTEISGG